MSKMPDESSLPDPAKPAHPAINRRSAGESVGPSTISDRFWGMFSQREKVIENLKTLAWVVPITLVIWIYAEREQVVSPNGPNVFSVPILINKDPNRYIELVGNQEPTLNLKLTGPQQAFERVKEKLTAIPTPLRIDIGASLGIGQKQPVNILDHIQDADLFKSNGVTVQQVEPANLYVNIDRLSQRELTVQVPTDVTNLSEVTFDPPKVVVHGPEQLLARLYPDTEPQGVPAALTGISQLKTPGKHTIPSILLVIPPDNRLKFEPAQVKADFTVQDTDVDWVIEIMPIVMVVPPSVAKTFDVVVNNGVESISRTRVRGPKEKIDDLKGDIPVFHPKAQLDIDGLETSGSEQLRYILPPGVIVDKEDEARKIDFKLTQRKDSGN